MSLVNDSLKSDGSHDDRPPEVVAFTPVWPSRRFYWSAGILTALSLTVGIIVAQNLLNVPYLASGEIDGSTAYRHECGRDSRSRCAASELDQRSRIVDRIHAERRAVHRSRRRESDHRDRQLPQRFRELHGYRDASEHAVHRERKRFGIELASVRRLVCYRLMPMTKWSAVCRGGVGGRQC